MKESWVAPFVYGRNFVYKRNLEVGVAARRTSFGLQMFGRSFSHASSLWQRLLLLAVELAKHVVVVLGSLLIAV